MKKVTYLFYSLICSFIITYAAFAQTMDSAAVKPFNDGIDKLQKGDNNGALADFQAALAVDKDYRIYYQMGIAHEKLNNLDEAAKDFQNTVNVKPDFEAAYNDLGNVYFTQGKYQEAIDNFQKVLSTSKDSTLIATENHNIALSYTSLGSAAEKSKNNKKAIEFYTKAVSFNNYDVAYLGLAKNYVVTNQIPKAITAAQNALKYKKVISEAGPNYFLGICYQKKNDNKKAKEYLEKVKGDPVYGNAAETVLKAMDANNK